MTKMTVLHLASPFAFTMPVQKQPMASVHNRKDADQPGTGSETESGDLSLEPPARGADRVSLVAGDGAPSRSQATIALTRYDAVLNHYRDASASLTNEGDGGGGFTVPS